MTLSLSRRLPLLITGIAGVAGYNALRYFQIKYPGRVIGIRQRDNWRLRGPGIEICDAEDSDTLARLFDEYHFAAVLDCGGNCALKHCELDPRVAWMMNVEAVRHLLEVADGRDVRLVRLSIDLVFSGLRPGGYVERDPTDPVTIYGQSMAVAEELMLAAEPRACILRISLPMGVSFNGHAGAIDWIQSRFKHGRPATLYFDEIRTPTYTDCLNEVCEEVLASDLRGLYHAGGPRRLSLYQIAQIVNRIGGYDPELLLGIPRRLAGPMPPRAGDVSMDSAKLAAALGRAPFDPWPLHDTHAPTHEHWHYERTRDITGSKALLVEVLYRNPRRNLEIGLSAPLGAPANERSAPLRPDIFGSTCK
jgi:dTDP-4-dehydrorhamnose reductase